jgi:hypothetical protein
MVHQPYRFPLAFLFSFQKFDTVTKKNQFFVPNLVIFVKKSPKLEKYKS